MQMKTALCALMATAGLVMAGCGSDDSGDTTNTGGSGGASGGSGGSGGSGNSTSGGGSGNSTSGGGSGNSTSGGGSGGGGTATGCPDDPHVTEISDGVCSVNSSLSDPITADLTMSADFEWFLEGPAIIGDDSDATTLTIEPGVTVYGSDASFILIQRHSKIMAEGTKDAPIVLTSAQDVGSRGVQDWGGLVINGLAPINNADGTAGDADAAPGEANTGRYGGTDAADNSGSLKYVRVEFAGKDIDPENELNGIAFQGVGSGTKVDYVQVHMVQDDAVEFFGGTVQVKHLLLTGVNDDGFDWTGGFSGKAQFVATKELPESGDLSSDPRWGIEADNLEADNSATPFANPTLSNFTLVGRSDNALEGVRFRRGTKGQLWNSIIQGEGFCIKASEDQTIANISDGSLVVENLVLDCALGDTEAGDPAEALLSAATTVVSGDPMLGGPNAFDVIPQDGSPALGIGAGPTDSFFDSVDYAGAFDGTNDWTDGWTETATK